MSSNICKENEIIWLSEVLKDLDFDIYGYVS